MFIYIFTAHRDRQIGKFRTRSDPQEKSAVELHDVKMYELFQNLLGEIVHHAGVTERRVSCAAHFGFEGPKRAATSGHEREWPTEPLPV